MHSLTRTVRAFLAVLLSAGSLSAQVATPPAAGPAGEAAELVRQGRKLGNEGKQDEAMALYAKAIALAPDLADAHMATGVALDLKGEYTRAREHIARAIELSPAASKAAALKNMAISYAFERKAAEAEKYEQQAFDLQMAAGEPVLAGETANELARIYIESGDLDNSLKWYRKGYETASRKPGMTDAEKDLWSFRMHHAEARIAARRGNAKEALDHVAMAKAALDKGTNPEQLRFFPYLSGYVAFYAGDIKKAIADLLTADQRDPFILSLLAQAYEKSGDKAVAMDYWRKVLTFNMHNPTMAFSRPLARQKVS